MTRAGELFEAANNKSGDGSQKQRARKKPVGENERNGVHFIRAAAASLRLSPSTMPSFSRSPQPTVTPRNEQKTIPVAEVALGKDEVRACVQDEVEVSGTVGEASRPSALGPDLAWSKPPFADALPGKRIHPGLCLGAVILLVIFVFLDLVLKPGSEEALDLVLKALPFLLGLAVCGRLLYVGWWPEKGLAGILLLLFLIHAVNRNPARYVFERFGLLQRSRAVETTASGRTLQDPHSDILSLPTSE